MNATTATGTGTRFARIEAVADQRASSEATGLAHYILDTGLVLTFGFVAVGYVVGSLLMLAK